MITVSTEWENILLHITCSPNGGQTPCNTAASPEVQMKRQWKLHCSPWNVPDLQNSWHVLTQWSRVESNFRAAPNLILIQYSSLRGPFNSRQKELSAHFCDDNLKNWKWVQKELKFAPLFALIFLVLKCHHKMHFQPQNQFTSKKSIHKLGCLTVVRNESSFFWENQFEYKIN